MDIFKDMMIITNNSLVCDKFNKSRSVVFVDGGYMDVLRNVRDRIHKGSKLISHPLMGSVKPNETPYRTIIIRNSEENLDIDSLSIIEDSIEACNKFLMNRQAPIWNEKILEDFRFVDFKLIESALSSLEICF